MKIENIEQVDITYTGNYKIRTIKTQMNAHYQRSIEQVYITFLKLENASEKDIYSFLEEKELFIMSIERID